MGDWHRNITRNRSLQKKNNENGRQVIQLSIEYNTEIISTYYSIKIYNLRRIEEHGRDVQSYSDIKKYNASKLREENGKMNYQKKFQFCIIMMTARMNIK